MAIPEYFQRNAVAAAQAISGLDEERLASVLDHVRIGITLGDDAGNREGRALGDLLVRLLARLYPVLLVRSARDRPAAEAAMELGTRINPRMESSGKPTIEVVIGKTRARPWAPVRIFAGSSAWKGTVSTSRIAACGDSEVPFGPGVAACLAAANVFRLVFQPEARLDRSAEFDVLEGQPGIPEPREPCDFVLAGAGAIGSAAAWALARVETKGSVAIVDHQRVDLGNLQRYVLAEREDENRSKPAVLANHFKAGLGATTHEMTMAEFLEVRKHRVERLLLALDSAADRRAAQASLPRWVANAWTQPRDLGVSTHDFINGACVSCLYLPQRTLKNEDEIIAEALGVPGNLMQIRLLLHRGEGAPRDLLEAVAAARAIPVERLLPFEGRPLRDLYVQGFCGGAVIPLKDVGAPRPEVHVPLAHQSALAGVLLGAAAIRYAAEPNRGTHITQVDVLSPLAPERSRPAAKDPRGICICQDRDYIKTYSRKFTS